MYLANPVRRRGRDRHDRKSETGHHTAQSLRNLASGGGHERFGHRTSRHQYVRLGFQYCLASLTEINMMSASNAGALGDVDEAMVRANLSWQA